MAVRMQDMSRRRKDPLRALSADERHELTRLSRSQGAPAAQVARAAALLAVADGQSCLAAARPAGPVAATATPWRPGSPASTARGSPRYGRPSHGGRPTLRYGDEQQ